MFLTVTMLLYCTADAAVATWLALTCGTGWYWMVIANAIMAGFWICALRKQAPTKSGTTGPDKLVKETYPKPKSNPNPNPNFTPPASVKVISGTGRIDVQATLDAARDNK